MEYRFKVFFLEEASDFLDGLDDKTKEKIIYNIWKSRSISNYELFKKLEGDIWEFRTHYNKTYYRLFAFWDKTEKENTLVIATHGIIKKTSKIPKNEIEKATSIMKKYFNDI